MTDVLPDFLGSGTVTVIDFDYLSVMDEEVYVACAYR